jgi:hypothetical protein
MSFMLIRVIHVIAHVDQFLLPGLITGVPSAHIGQASGW